MSRGTIWESANIAANQKLDNLTVFVDWNGSAEQLMPIDDLENSGNHLDGIQLQLMVMTMIN